jgi:hypothetical protein
MNQINNFRKPIGNNSQPTFYGDNRQDEMMATVLEIFPKHKQNIFRGDKGLMRKKLLQQEVRSYFNFLQGVDEDEYFNARGRRGRFGEKIKKGLKKISIENAKKGLKKISVKNISEGVKKVGRIAKRAALAIPRGAFLAVVRLNFRGLASRYNILTEEGKKKFYAKWEKMGGKTDALQRAVDAGKTKPIIACGVKCRAKAGKNPQIKTDEFVNFTGFDDAAVVSAALGVIAAMTKAIGDKSNYKSQIELAKIDADTQKAEDEEKKIDATMSPQDRALADEIIKAQESNFDVVKAITENPNLTAEEKTAALEDLKNDVVGEGLTTGKKIGIAIGLIALLGIGFYFMNKNKN